MSLLGVNNINNLTECTKVLPLPVTSFTSQDQDAIDSFLDGVANLTAAAELLAGDLLQKRDPRGLPSRLPS